MKLTELKTCNFLDQMGGSHFSFLLLLCLLQLLHLSLSLPLCTDSRAPLPHNVSSPFCPYNGTSCCDSNDDLQLQKQFKAMNISDPTCASIVKSILCAKCDPFSAELYRISSGPRQAPVLCNSTTSANSSQSKQAASSFCSQVWGACKNVSVVNSLFTPSQGPGDQAKLADVWKSDTVFCDAFGAASGDDLVCFDGGPVTMNNTETPISPSGMCLEKIGNDSYLSMAPHPDGSARAFFANQPGVIWLATVPSEESGGTLGLDESNPFLDLTDQVTYETEFGLMAIAAHPQFSANGRFFVSYNCDKTKAPGCGGRCSCNSEVNCDPTKLPNDSGSFPCQYQSVVAEYTVNGTASQPSLAINAQPAEVRRIFTMGLPFTSHHAGQILFGPADGYLYFITGDGGGSGDPYNFAQNKKSLLGKILRLDVDNMPSASEITQLGLWGNYSIPRDNPYTEDRDLQPEIWAMGLRNPWRCSFDSARPSYFMCADPGQDLYESVDIITKGGNYGWRTYEGPYPFNPPNSSGGNTSVNSTEHILPVMGYNHSAVNKNEGSASITGGYFYRSMTDPCLNGRYLFMDLYAGGLWAGIENPESSGNFTTNEIPFACAHDSPISCSFMPGASVPSLGYIFSFGEDNNKDVYLLTSSGVYRVVRPSRCKYTCSKETSSPGVTPSPTSQPPSEANTLIHKRLYFVLMLFSVWFLLNFRG